MAGLWGIAARPADVAILLVLYVLTGLGITVGFHRLFTHCSFETTRPLRVLWAVLGSLDAPQTMELIRLRSDETSRRFDQPAAAGPIMACSK